MPTNIEWTDETWNPVRGCSRVSEGCRNCYAERVAARFSTSQMETIAVDPGAVTRVSFPGVFQGFAKMTPSGPRWTGRVELIESKLTEPLHRKKPKRIFVNSMSDLFHEALPHKDRVRVFSKMREAPQHIYQILTKRGQVMRDFGEWWCMQHVEPQMPSNWWFGVSVEDQKTADERIPLLLQTPASVRFVSYEPALGAVDFKRWICYTAPLSQHTFLDWIIAGGESGPGARPTHPQWFRFVRDQCQTAGVAFFFKQWGEWAPVADHGFGGRDHRATHTFANEDGTGIEMIHIGKKAAGAMLDGREWREFPKTATFRI